MTQSGGLKYWKNEPANAIIQTIAAIPPLLGSVMNRASSQSDDISTAIASIISEARRQRPGGVDDLETNYWKLPQLAVSDPRTSRGITAVQREIGTDARFIIAGEALARAIAANEPYRFTEWSTIGSAVQYPANVIMLSEAQFKSIPREVQPQMPSQFSVNFMGRSVEYELRVMMRRWLDDDRVEFPTIIHKGDEWITCYDECECEVAEGISLSSKDEYEPDKDDPAYEPAKYFYQLRVKKAVAKKADAPGSAAKPSGEGMRHADLHETRSAIPGISPT
jgi:hypothetical protein